jgi:HD superfamily phosphohydrolase
VWSNLAEEVKAEFAGFSARLDYQVFLEYLRRCEAQREYMATYMRERRRMDEEFRERCKAHHRAWFARMYADPARRAKEQEAARNRMRKMREKRRGLQGP